MNKQTQISQYVFDGYKSKQEDSSYRINISQPIERCSHMRFSSIIIPYTWYNIDERWNKLCFQEEGKTQVEITFDPKNYVVANFLSLLESKMTTASQVANTYSAVVALDTGKLTISATNQNPTKFRIIFADTYDFLNGLLGYWEDTATAYATSLTGTYVFSLRPVKSIFVQSDCVRSQTVNQDSGQVLYSINLIDEVYGDVVSPAYGITLPWIETVIHHLQSITFRVTDDQNRPLRLNGAEIRGSIEFLHY